MKIRSAKQKGRRAAIELKNLLLKHSEGALNEYDVLPTSSSVPGRDLFLSQKALEIYPFVVEVKNQERLNIWEAIEQATSHKEEYEEGLIPLVAFMRNRSKMFICLEANDFLNLLKKKKP